MFVLCAPFLHAHTLYESVTFSAAAVNLADSCANLETNYFRLLLGNVISLEAVFDKTERLTHKHTLNVTTGG